MPSIFGFGKSNDEPAETTTPTTTSTGDEVRKRNVFMPVDGSDHCRRAFTWYLNHIRRPGDCIHFAHVVLPGFTGGDAIATNVMAMPTSVANSYAKIEDDVKTSKTMLHEFVEEAKNKELATAQATVYVNARPGPALVDCAKQNKADLVVMGNRGLGLVRRTFMGSVSDYVLHHSDTPVLIVPPTGNASQ